MRYLILVLLFCGSVSAQTWNVDPRLDTLRILCYEHLNIGAATSVVTEKKVDHALNLATQQVCIDFPAIEKLDTIGTAGNRVGKEVEAASLNTDFMRAKALYRIMGDSIRVPLEFVPIDSLRRLQQTQGKNAQSRANRLSPQYYSTFAQKLFFYPRYSKDTADSDTFLMYYYALGAKLSSANDSTTVLPEYMDALIYYACGKLSEMRGNMTDAAYFFAQYDKMARTRKPREVDLKK